jgi:hypothetical protein
MAILGNNVEGGSTFSASTGRKVASKFTLSASGQAILELHCLLYPGSAGLGGNTYTIHCYADSSGNPGALVAYTSAITVGGGGVVVELSETGLAVPIAPGDYWLGATSTFTRGDFRYSGGGTHRAILGGATVSPPSDPFGSPDHSGSNNFSVWAVIGGAAAAFVPQVVIT